MKHLLTDCAANFCLPFATPRTGSPNPRDDGPDSAASNRPGCLRRRRISGPRLLFRLGLLVLIGSGLICGPSVRAQDDDEVPTPRVDLEQRLQVDRQTSAALENLRQSLRSGDDTTALRELNRLRTADPNLMVRDEQDDGVFIPLYRAVFREFHRLPPALRDRFRATNEAASRRELDTALQQGQLPALVRLLHRYPGTAASLEACLLLARQHRDRGEFLAAQVYARELDRDGIDDRFRQLGAALLAELAPDSDSLLTGPQNDEPDLSSTPATDPDGSPAASLTRSDPEAAATAEQPLFLQWQYRPSLSSKLQETVAEFLAASTETRVVPRTTWSVGLQDGTIFRRTMRGVAAIDGRTGKPRWHYPLTPNHEALLEEQKLTRTTYNPVWNAIGNGAAEQKFRTLEKTALVDLFCRDGVRSRVTEDESRIYLVNDGTDESLTGRSRRFFPGGVGSALYRGSELIALEKQSGRRVWSIGGQVVEQAGAGDLATAWFAGPPTVDRDRLLGVTETGGQIDLVCLTAATGELRWQVPLAFPEQSITHDPVRRLWSATPTLAGGLIWCPTTTGWLVAVDQLTHTVVWAAKIQTQQDSEPQMPVPRGRQFIRTDQESLIDSWAPHPPYLAGNRLLVFPQESHRICILDPVTGTAVRQVPAEPSAVVLFLNEQQLVTSTGLAIRSYDTQTARTMWERGLTAADGFPTGSGVARDGRLLLPMSNGTLASLDPGTGALQDGPRVPLPNPGWGHLVEVGDDLLTVAPDRMLRLSATELNPDLQDPLELAAALAAAGNWSAALESLQQVPETERNNPQLHQILFQCRYQLAVRDPEQHLQPLQLVAATADEKLRVSVLTTRQMLQDGNRDQAALALLDILKQEPSLLLSSESLPGLTRPDESTHSPGETQIRQQLPLTTWAARQFSQVLQQVSPQLKQQLLQDLRQLPDRVLLQLSVFATAADSPEATQAAADSDATTTSASDSSVTTRQVAQGIQELLNERIQQAESDETKLHLLLHSFELEDSRRDGNVEPETSAGSFAEPLQAFRQVLVRNQQRLQADQLSDNPGWLSARTLLLNCLALNLSQQWQLPLEQFSPSAASPPEDAPAQNSSLAAELLTHEQLTQQFQQSLRAVWQQWPDQPYQLMPFAQPSGLVGSSSNVYPQTSEDPFLQQYSWTARSNPARLQAAALADPAQEAWSVPANLGNRSYYSVHNETIHRCGSVLLVQSTTGLTAISVLDQRVLWTRSHVQDSGFSVAGTPGIHFQSFEAHLRLRPSERSGKSWRVIPAGPRQVCLWGGKNVETIDLLTGQTLWTVSLDQIPEQVAATHQLVFIGSQYQDRVWCFRLTDGAPVTSALTSDQLARTITGVGSQLVIWRLGSGADNGGRLDWFNPETSQVEQTVRLQPAQRYHFADDLLLAAVSHDQQLQLVNLQTGRLQSVSFAMSQSGNPPDDAAVKQQSETEHALWTTERVIVTPDPLTWYVVNTASPGQPRLYQGASQTATVFEGGIRAIDRESEQLRFSDDSSDVVLGTTDQPGLPVLVLVRRDETVALPNQAPVTRTAFRGLHKFSGQQLFDVVVPTRFNVHAFWISTDRRQALEIEVYGNHVRLEPDGASAVIRP